MYNTCECPYCGHKNDMTDCLEGLSNDNTTDWECSKCEKEFEVHVEFEPSYTASEIVYKECEKCGTTTRDIYEKGRIFPWPNMAEERVCQSCFRKAHAEDFKALKSR